MVKKFSSRINVKNTKSTGVFQNTFKHGDGKLRDEEKNILLPKKKKIHKLFISIKNSCPNLHNLEVKMQIEIFQNYK